MRDATMIRGLAALTLGAVLAAGGCGAAQLTGASASGAPASSAASSAAQISVQASGTSAADALAQLPVKGRAPKTGYSRDQFGPAWADVDHNGCDQRNDVLARDLTGETFRPGTHDCIVLTGTLADPYTGRSIAFVRGVGTSDDVQIDHRVSLSNAWQTGAQQLTAEQRRQLAGDPANLQATDGPTNARKGDADAATWLPPNTAYRCQYVASQIAVKAKYGLWVTAAEHDAMAGILTGCPGQPLPTEAK